jgi:hypothetical protein
VSAAPIGGASTSSVARTRGSYVLHGVGLRLSGDDSRLLARVETILEHCGLAPVDGALDPSALRMHFARHMPPLPGDAHEVAHQDGIRALDAGSVLWLATEDHRIRLDLAAGSAEAACPQVPTALRKDLVLYVLLLLLRRRELFALHASAVVERGAGCLLVAPSENGKSTSTFALVRRGWSYLGDDALLLQQAGDGVEALALRRDLCLDPALRKPFPEVALHGQPGPFAARGKHRLDMRALFPDRLVDRCLPRVLLFPEIVREARSHLVPVSPPEVLARLVAQSAVLALDLEMVPRHVELLGCLARQARSYRLLAGRDLAAHPEGVADLLSTVAPSGLPSSA